MRVTGSKAAGQRVGSISPGAWRRFRGYNSGKSIRGGLSVGKLPKRNLLVARVLIGFVICLNPVQGQSGTSNLGTASTNGTTGRWPNVIVNFLVDGRGHAPPRQVTASSLRVLDDGVEQKIQAFSGPGGPVSLCIEIDVSGSMKSNHDNVADAAKQLVKNLPPGSEVMVVAFNKKPSLVAPFTPANDFDLTLFDRMYSLWRTALDDSTIFAEQYFVQHARYRLRARCSSPMAAKMRRSRASGPRYAPWRLREAHWCTGFRSFPPIQPPQRNVWPNSFVIHQMASAFSVQPTARNSQGRERKSPSA